MYVKMYIAHVGNIIHAFSLSKLEKNVQISGFIGLKEAHPLIGYIYFKLVLINFII